MNRKSIHILVYVTILCYSIALCSCGNAEKEVTATEHYDLIDLKNGSIQDVFTSVECTPLRFEQETYPSSIRKYDVSDSLIVVVDRKEIIHVFDHQGHYVSCSKVKCGNGPGEYNVLMDGFIGKNGNDIVVISPFKLIKYDKKFNVKMDATLPIKIGKSAELYDYGYEYEDNRYLLLPQPYSENPFRVDFYDAEKGKVLKSSTYFSDVTVFGGMQNNCFMMSDSSLLLCSPAYTDAIYKIEDNKVGPYISFTFDDKIISQGDLKQISTDGDELFDYLAKSQEDFPAIRLINSTVALNTIRRGLNLKDVYTIVSNRKTGKSFKIKLHNGTNYTFPYIQFMDEGNAYAIWAKRLILSNPELLMGLKGAEDRLKDIDEEDYVLLKYKFIK